MPVEIFGSDAAKIAHVAPPENGGVAVEDFAPFSRTREANAVLEARNWRKVQDDDEFAEAFGVLTEEAKNAAFVA